MELRELHSKSLLNYTIYYWICRYDSYQFVHALSFLTIASSHHHFLSITLYVCIEKGYTLHQCIHLRIDDKMMK